MMGMALMAMANGVMISEARRNRVTSSAAITAAIAPASRPVTIMKPVTRAPVKILSKSSKKAPTISDGGGRTNPSGSKMASAPSQKPNITTPQMRGADQARTRCLIGLRPPEALRERW